MSTDAPITEHSNDDLRFYAKTYSNVQLREMIRLAKQLGFDDDVRLWKATLAFKTEEGITP